MENISLKIKNMHSGFVVSVLDYVHTVSFSSVFSHVVLQKVSILRRVHTKTDENNVNWRKRFQY